MGVSFFRSFEVFLMLLFFGITNQGSAQSTKEFKTGTDTLVVYADVPGLAPSEFYKIRVRSAATKNQWVECFANITRSLYSTLPADALGTPNSREHYYSYVKDWSHTYANIEMSKGMPVEVEISSNNGFKIQGKDFSFAAAHPAQKASKPTVKDNKVYFTITHPAQITIDINGQLDDTNTGNGYAGAAIHTVSLFANPVIEKPAMNKMGVFVVKPGETPPSDPNAYKTLIFAPGLHNVGRSFKVHPNRNYYIPGDAIVYGTFNNIGLASGENTLIYGYGTLCGDKIQHPNYDPARKAGADGKEWKTIYAENCKNFRVEGISIVNPPMHTINLNASKSKEKETICKWLKVITWRCNGDGIGSAHEISDCFIRTQDDCTYVKGDRKRCVFWTDVNGSVFVLAGIPTERPIVIEDCDVIYPRHCSTKWNGGRIFSKRGPQQAAQGTTQVNVIFKDIRVSDKFQTLETFNLYSIDKAGKSGAYSGIVFKNISTAKTPSEGDNKIVGHSQGPWKDLTFDNVVLGNKKVEKMSDFGKIGENVTDLIFK